MVNKNYKPSMKPTIEDNKTIRVSKGYGRSLDLTEKELEILKSYLVGEAICPGIYWFTDNEITRKLLKVDINK